jgi:hypothetical protein
MHTEGVAIVDKGQSRPDRRQPRRLPGPKYRTPRAATRRYNNFVARFANELGGWNALNAAARELVRQAAAMMLRSEQLHAAIVRGEQIDPDELIRLSSEGRRVLRALGLKTKDEPSTEAPTAPWSPLRSRLAAADPAMEPTP